MSTTAEEMAAVAAAVETVRRSGDNPNERTLQCWAYPPANVVPPGAFVHIPDRVDYHNDMGGGKVLHLAVTLLVSKADARNYRNLLVPYLDEEGEHSVMAAIEAGAELRQLGLSVSVTTARPNIISIAGQEYWCVVFDIEAVK